MSLYTAEGGGGRGGLHSEFYSMLKQSLFVAIWFEWMYFEILKSPPIHPKQK